MPLYEYICTSCGSKKEIFKFKPEPPQFVECRCGNQMAKMISQVNTDLVENVRYSSSMGVNSRQIHEAMRKFPDSEYTPDGRLIVNSRKDKLKKMRERKLVEFE